MTVQRTDESDASPIIATVFVRDILVIPIDDKLLMRVTWPSKNSSEVVNETTIKSNAYSIYALGMKCFELR